MSLSLYWRKWVVSRYHRLKVWAIRDESTPSLPCPRCFVIRGFVEFSTVCVFCDGIGWRFSILCKQCWRETAPVLIPVYYRRGLDLLTQEYGSQYLVPSWEQLVERIITEKLREDPKCYL